MTKLIKHALNKNKMRKEGEARYLCIGAVYPTYEKVTTKYSEITCKRCLDILYRDSGIKEK